jgi:hypothetical protein
MGHCQEILTRYRSLLMTAPVPWSLAWSDNGDLAPQDQLDLLQCLVACESASWLWRTTACWPPLMSPAFAPEPQPLPRAS